MGISYKLLNRDGFSVLDIIETQNSSKWLPQIQQLFKENNYFVPKNKEELLNDILISKKDCLENVSDNCEVNIKLDDVAKKT